MPTVDSRTGLEVLDRDECLRLLGSHPVGRVAVVVDAGPLIFPVNYALDGDSIVFRSDAGSKVSGASSGFPMSFEIDGIDEVLHTGWSVVVNGVGREVVSSMAPSSRGCAHWNSDPGRRVPRRTGFASSPRR